MQQLLAANPHLHLDRNLDEYYQIKLSEMVIYWLLGTILSPCRGLLWLNNALWNYNAKNTLKPKAWKKMDYEVFLTLIAFYNKKVSCFASIKMFPDQTVVSYAVC